MSIADVALSPIHKESVTFSHYSDTALVPVFGDSILIYLAIGNAVIPMCVSESDSIALVKLRIQTCKGFVVKNQRLVFGGRELARNRSLVRDYGVADGNVLHLVLRLSDLLAITVRTTCGKELEFHVDRYQKVWYLKQRIAKSGGKGFVGLVDDQELFCNGEKLDNERLIDDICRSNDAVIHLLVKKPAKVRARPIKKDFELSVVAASANERRDERVDIGENPSPVLPISLRGLADKDFWLEPVLANTKITLPPLIWDLINSTYVGLETGNRPMRSSEGSGGAYFMQNSLGDKCVSVFKPMDEEPNAVNNPRGLPVSLNGEGLKSGTRVGEGAFREVAAYILDHPISGPRSVIGEEIGFAGVPPTVMVQCLHEGFNHPEGFRGLPENIKIGSLQMFMKNEGSCEDMGPRDFPVEEVHKISVFDIRMANADRHAGNILVSREGKEGHIKLIPIDHGYCLPENFEDCTFDWLYWPQAQKPYNPDTINYIKSLDAEQDIMLLKFYGWEMSPKCARTLRISTMLLKKGAERGLSPFAIGSIMCRENMKKKSVIEEIVHEAQGLVLPGMSEAAFLEVVSLTMDSWLDKLAN